VAPAGECINEYLHFGMLLQYNAMLIAQGAFHVLIVTLDDVPIWRNAASEIDMFSYTNGAAVQLA